ncbi:hypothetical protein SeLEV6574_g04201 [Synchytrium endobioticum]|uniref:Uncharacterized protein n=1 Tax=Synchytrium endobioticum TaxID=286115 RepID=A0A507D0B2_9FUNG|nr:hypothetical protein SeLEV6574_g04201 [Synchytrium endobioticum]
MLIATTTTTIDIPVPNANPLLDPYIHISWYMHWKLYWLLCLLLLLPTTVAAYLVLYLAIPRIAEHVIDTVDMPEISLPALEALTISLTSVTPASFKIAISSIGPAAVHVPVPVTLALAPANVTLDNQNIVVVAVEPIHISGNTLNMDVTVTLPNPEMLRSMVHRLIHCFTNSLDGDAFRLPTHLAFAVSTAIQITLFNHLQLGKIMVERAIEIPSSPLPLPDLTKLLKSNISVNLCRFGDRLSLWRIPFSFTVDVEIPLSLHVSRDVVAYVAVDTFVGEQDAPVASLAISPMIQGRRVSIKIAGSLMLGNTFRSFSDMYSSITRGTCATIRIQELDTKATCLKTTLSGTAVTVPIRPMQIAMHYLAKARLKEILRKRWVSTIDYSQP